MRHCTICKCNGHNSRTCPQRPTTNDATATTSTVVVAEQESQVDRLPVDDSLAPFNDGIALDEDNVVFSKPRKGLWFVSQSRKRIAGKILYVRSTGGFVYENSLGCHCESDSIKAAESGYQFVDLQPKMLIWRCD